MSRESRDVAKDLKRLLDNVDSDDFRRMTARENPEARGIANHFLRRYELSQTDTNILENVLKTGSNFAEFQNQLSTYRETYIADAQKSAEAPLKNTVETFSGDQDEVPKYVMNLLTCLAETSVLYLTGAQDARKERSSRR